MNLCNRIGLILMFVWLILDAKIEAYKSGCSGGYCFIMSDYTNNNELLDQSNAQQRCQSNGTKLVEIISEDIQNSLVNSIRSVYSQGFNGWSVLTNGKRSSGNWIRLSGNSFGDLQANEQTELFFAYGYLRSTTSGFDLFASRPTNNKGGFICTGLSDCSDGVTLSGTCYKSFSETLSWYDARNRCLDRGGDLASFDYITKNDGFNALNGSWINPSNSYWIGIRREWWTWQGTNSDVRYSAWLTGHPVNEFDQPNTDCLCLSTTEWKWIECGCTQQLPFVCISETNTSTSTSTTTRTTTSSVTFSTRIAASMTASKVASESPGVPTPTISATILTVNDTEQMKQSVGLSTSEVGVAVGLCVGIPLIIVIAVLAIIIVRWKKKHSFRFRQDVQVDTNKKRRQRMKFNNRRLEV